MFTRIFKYRIDKNVIVIDLWLIRLVKGLV